MARTSIFRAEAGTFTIHWAEAGDKQYSGLALVRGTSTGKDAAMLRVSDKATADEYRSLAEACRSLADYADKAAEVAEAAAKDATTYSKPQLERIREAIKSAAPANRVVLAVALGVDLSDFGYLPDGKARAEKPPTPPNGAGSAAEAKLAAVLGTGK